MTAAGEATYSVSALCAEIQSFLAAAFPALWVVGEAQRVRRSQRGHLYLELIEKDGGEGVAAKLDAVLWRTDHERIARLLAASGQRIDEGVELRCRVTVDFYGPGGRLQLVVREVDPVFTLGLLERRRRELLAELVASGAAERNRRLELAELPLAIALITSEGSAAYHDFLSGLAESGYGFRVTLLHTSVQGKTAEAEIASALAAAASLDVDCVVLIRGGGSRSDLAVFDSRAVALAIAGSPVPVLTGLGHEIDEAIADRVAHTAVKTPTKVAELLVARLAEAEAGVAELARELRLAAGGPLRQAELRLAAAERGVAVARLRLAGAAQRLAELHRALARAGAGLLRGGALERERLSRRLAEAAPRALERRRREPERAAERLATAAGGPLRAAKAYLSGLERLCAELSPQRTLQRGFSITRDASGAVVRRPDAVQPGDRLVTETSGGSLSSRVETS